MTTPIRLVLVHGARGPQSEETWRDQLNAGLRAIDMPSLGDTDHLVCVDYATAMRSGSGSPALPAIIAVPDDGTPHAERFAVRQALLADELWQHCTPPVWVEAQRIDSTWTRAATFRQMKSNLELLKMYDEDTAARRRAQHAVLRAIAASPRCIVVAHSLGTVATADVLRRIGRGTTVELFLTLGSPLAAVEIGGAEHRLDRDFPFDRVLRWVNIYNGQDPVTGFRGFGRTLPAIDAHAGLGVFEHQLVHYLRSPLAAAAIGTVLFDRDPEADTGASPHARVATRLHPAWYPILLQTSYAARIAEKLPMKERRAKQRIEEALRLLATETLHAAATSHATNPGNDIVAPGRCPTQHDLLGGGWKLVQDAFTDLDLVPVVVTLMMSPLLADVGLDVDDDTWRRNAMVWLLNQVRKRGSNTSDHEYVEYVDEAIDWAWGVLGGGGVRWQHIAIGAGLVVLAATGVGLAVAAPAGLAGAAAITSTLAGFGPGGMVGGVATLAALTGTGTAATGIGVQSALTSGGRSTAVPTQSFDAHAAALLRVPLDQFRLALAQALATVKATVLLGGKPASTLFSTLVLARDALAARRAVLNRLSPESALVKKCDKQILLLEKSIKALAALLKAQGPALPANGSVTQDGAA